MRRKSSLVFILVVITLASVLSLVKINSLNNSRIPLKSNEKVSIQSDKLLPQLKVCLVGTAPMNCLNGFFTKNINRYYTKDLVNQLFLYRQAEPKATEYCHDIALAIGANAWQEFKDPSKAIAAGTPVCASGYLHGLQEAIGADLAIPKEKMLEDLYTICDQLTATEGDRSDMYKVCYHGIGHAANKRVGSDLKAGFAICAGLPTQVVRTPDTYEKAYTKRELCAEGVSMRYFETLTIESEKFTNEADPGMKSTNTYSNPYTLCDSVTDKSIRYGCFEYATRSFIHNHKNYTKVVTLCNYYSPEDQLPCFFGLSRELAYSPETKSYDNVVNYCLHASSPDAAYFCAQNAILNRITIDNDIETPVKVCQSLEVNAVTQRICAKVKISLKLTDSENTRNF